jgi:hypothetical protein
MRAVVVVHPGGRHAFVHAGRGRGRGRGREPRTAARWPTGAKDNAPKDAIRVTILNIIQVLNEHAAASRAITEADDILKDARRVQADELKVLGQLRNADKNNGNIKDARAYVDAVLDDPRKKHTGRTDEYTGIDIDKAKKAMDNVDEALKVREEKKKLEEEIEERLSVAKDEMTERLWRLANEHYKRSNSEDYAPGTEESISWWKAGFSEWGSRLTAVFGVGIFGLFTKSYDELTTSTHRCVLDLTSAFNYASNFFVDNKSKLFWVAAPVITSIITTCASVLIKFMSEKIVDLVVRLAPNSILAVRHQETMRIAIPLILGTATAAVVAYMGGTLLALTHEAIGASTHLVTNGWGIATQTIYPALVRWFASRDHWKQTPLPVATTDASKEDAKGSSWAAYLKPTGVFAGAFSTVAVVNTKVFKTVNYFSHAGTTLGSSVLMDGTVSGIAVRSEPHTRLEYPFSQRVWENYNNQQRTLVVRHFSPDVVLSSVGGEYTALEQFSTTVREEGKDNIVLNHRRLLAENKNEPEKWIVRTYTVSVNDGPRYIMHAPKISASVTVLPALQLIVEAMRPSWIPGLGAMWRTGGFTVATAGTGAWSRETPWAIDKYLPSAAEGNVCAAKWATKKTELEGIFAESKDANPKAGATDAWTLHLKELLRTNDSANTAFKRRLSGEFARLLETEEAKMYAKISECPEARRLTGEDIRKAQTTSEVTTAVDVWITDSDRTQTQKQCVQ